MTNDREDEDEVEDEKIYTESAADVRPLDEGTPRWIWLGFIALACVSILGLAEGWSAREHARSAERSVASQSQNVDTLSSRWLRNSSKTIGCSRTWAW